MFQALYLRDDQQDLRVLKMKRKDTSVLASGHQMWYIWWKNCPLSFL